MQRNQSFRRDAHGCLLEIAVTLLAVFAMLAFSANYRNFGDDFACSGRLGLGFPVSFLCDYGTGGSPISSWGRVDLADFPYFSPQGLIADILFYAGIFWIGWLVRRVLRHNDSYPVGNAVWVTFIVVAFLAGFLSAAAIYRSERINYQDYLLGIPTPMPATPTAFGTPPPPEVTLIPTAGP